MSEIIRSVDQGNQPSKIYRTTLELLADKLLQEKCMIFLGAGASFDHNKPGLPTGSELSKDMSEACGLEWHEYIPLSTIGFYYESFSSREILNKFIKGKIDNPKIQPSTTIEHLIKIIKILEEKNKRTLVMSTNYDRHFELAYKNEFGCEPEVVIYNGGIDPKEHRNKKLHVGLGDFEECPMRWVPQKNTCLYKMHGCISKPEGQNLVITEEDYINFLSNALSSDEKKKLLNYITGEISLKTILFVGYSLSDWNFRVIYKAVKEGINMESYAVQFFDASKSSEEAKKRWKIMTGFWEDKRVIIINTDASDFMGDLFLITREIANS
jgi:hypothetical protein